MSSRLKWKLAQRYEKAWWKKYLRGNTKEYLEFKRTYWLNIMKILSADFAENKAVLDVGCGPSGIFMVLDRSQVTAIDPLIENYEDELPVFSKNKYSWVQFLPTKIEEFEPEQTYDFIFCMNSINHFDNLTLTLHKLSGMMKKEGKLIISIDVHNYTFFKYFIRFSGIDVMHPYQLSLSDYSKLLAKEGFVIKKETILIKRFIFNHLLLIVEKAIT